MREIKGILFDFDDTLQDREAAFRKYAACFMDKYFPSMSPEEKQARVDYMDSTMEGGYLKRPIFFAGLINAWRWENAPSLQELEDEYNDQLPVHTTLFDDALEVVTQLRNRGYKLGILTNGFAPLQHKKLDISCVRPYFDAAVVSGDHPFAKPDVRLFNLAAEELGLPPESIAMIGDHPVNDIRGALDSGMLPIRMDYGFFKGKTVDGVREINTLTQLLDIFPGASKAVEVGTGGMVK